MKKKELLYRAVGGLDDGTVNDAMKHEAEKRDHSRLFTVLEGAAIVAVVCGLAVLSLLKYPVRTSKTIWIPCRHPSRQSMAKRRIRTVP